MVYWTCYIKTMLQTIKSKTYEYLSSKSRYVYFVLLGLFTQIVSILLPKNSSISDSEEAFCNFYITKLNIFNVHIDCDSQYFLLDSQDPTRLLNNQTPLQDRPLFTFLVFGISKVLELLRVPSGSITYLGEDGIPQNYHVLNYGLFILMNAIILTASITIVLSVFFKIKDPKTPLLKLSIFTAIILISQNPINREFFWTPHTQIFNVLVPALLFYLAQKNLILDKRQYYIWFCFISITLLMYPTLSILLPVLFVRVFQSLGKFYAFSLFLTLIPKLIWPGILNLLGGNYVDWPIVYHRRFVWILDSVESKTLLDDSSKKYQEFLNSLPLTWDIIAFLMFMIGLSLGRKIWKTGNWSNNSNFIYGGIVLVIYTLAMGLNGAYAPRFSGGIVLLLSLIVLFEVRKAKDKVILLKIAIFGSLSANCLYWLLN